MEAGEEGHGDEDDDCFFAVADFELLGWREVVLACVMLIHVAVWQVCDSTATA